MEDHATSKLALQASTEEFEAALATTKATMYVYTHPWL